MIINGAFIFLAVNQNAIFQNKFFSGSHDIRTVIANFIQTRRKLYVFAFSESTTSSSFNKLSKRIET